VPNVVHSFGAVLPASRSADAAVLVEPLWREHGLEPRPFGGAFDHLYLDIYPPSMQPRGDHSHLGRVQRVRVVSTHEPDDGRLPPDIAAAVTGDRPVVYLTFGTVFFVNPTFAAAIDALAHRSDLVTVVTVGPRGDTDAFGPQPEHVHLERFVPQETLLPRCTAVVSHGGSGTVLGTLAHGLPQLVLPQGADQFINADACVDSGVGLALHGPEADADAIGAAIAAMLETDDLRAGARRVQADIADMPSPDEAAAVIESL
jgi:UDP:flavonoid glycosyltransferase YjiC (YdhE family)